MRVADTCRNDTIITCCCMSFRRPWASVPRRALLGRGLALAGSVVPLACSTVFTSAARVALADSATAGAADAPASAYLPADADTETYRQKWALSCEYAATHTALRLLGFDVSEDTMRALAGSGEDPDE